MNTTTTPTQPDELTPFQSYKITYSDGQTQDVSIRANLKEAKDYYIGVVFGYWCAATCSEKYHVAVNCEVLS